MLIFTNNSMVIFSFHTTILKIPNIMHVLLLNLINIFVIVLFALALYHLYLIPNLLTKINILMDFILISSIMTLTTKIFSLILPTLDLLKDFVLLTKIITFHVLCMAFMMLIFSSVKNKILKCVPLWKTGHLLKPCLFI